MNQTTILNPISCYGIGVHSGKNTQITLKPAPANSGVTFVRTDITSVDNIVSASYDNVFETTLSTSIKNDASVKVSTIEHLMAAIWGCGISNLIIEIDGQEVPIMDGSSKAFVFMIECAGIKTLDAKSKQLKLLKDVHVVDNGCEIFASPSDKLSLDLTIDFKSKAIGRQSHLLENKKSFLSEVADCRTFGFVHELEYLQSKGLAKGASLDTAIGIENDVILNHDGLRRENEFVKHKMLDLVGDLFSMGGDFMCNINGSKTSHYLNNQFLRKIFDNPYSYEWVN